MISKPHHRIPSQSPTMRANIHSQERHITSTLGTTGNLLYVTHVNPAQSAFSLSSTPSLMSDRSLDKSFFRRMFTRGKARFTQGTTSRNRRPSATHSAPESPVVFEMTPSPHTHPLLSKPSARDELRTNYRHGKRISRTSSHGDLGSTKGRYSRTRQRALQHGSIENDSYDSIDVYDLASPDMYARNLRNRERVAMNAAVDGRYVSEWGFFIKCYSEGRFNVSNPPDPPPRRPEFNHLAAPAPPNERLRLQAVRDCNVSLTTTAHEKLQRLVLLSKKVFQTRMTSMSLIDQHDEIIKVGDSLNRSFIDREDSLGAHVLLANEPMVILDTQEDWRLRGNPLVTGSPMIRFYAGAPIVTHEGHTIGVFAVFDSQPRTSFPAASRRKLMDFARLVMTEIELAVEERDLVQQLNRKFNSTRRRQTSDTDSVMSRRSRITARLLQGFEDDASAFPEESALPEHLADSPTIESWPQSPMRPPTPAEEPSFTPTTEKSIPEVSISLATPPSTPHLLSRASSTQGPPTQTRNSLESVATSSRSDATLGASGPRYRSRRPPPIHLAPQAYPSSPLPRSPSNMSSLAEATFATSLIARSLNYDLVYLLRLTRTPITPSPYLPVDPYQPREEIHTRVLVAHGLPHPPPKFDAALHLRALNSAGGLIYQNPVDGRSEIDNVGYQVGILMPLAKDGGDREGGIVLAAYARGGGGKKRFGEREVEFLRDFGGAMRDVLVKADTPGFEPLKKLF